MATLKQILLRTKRKAVRGELEKRSVELLRIRAYGKVFRDLRELRPRRSADLVDLRIRVRVRRKEFEADGTDGSPESFGLDFTPWRAWLALEVIEGPTDAEVVAGCIDEMTFNGFTGEEVARARRNLRRMVARLEEAERQGRSQKGISLEDFRRKLGLGE